MSNSSRKRLKSPVEAMTLASMLAALDRAGKLSATRKRDLRSAVNAVANLLGDEPAGIVLDIPAISCPAQHHQPPCGWHDGQALRKYPIRLPSVGKAFAVCSRSLTGSSLSPEWAKLFKRLSGRRSHIGLSRLARYASAVGSSRATSTMTSLPPSSLRFGRFVAPKPEQTASASDADLERGSSARARPRSSDCDSRVVPRPA